MANPPITTWPGHTGGYVVPPGAAFNRTPIFGADTGPRYTGPFNFNLGSSGQGSMMAMLLPQMLQGFMGERMPAQYNPEQNLWTQMQANQFFAANQQATAAASQRDTGAVADTLGGIMRMRTGKPLTALQKANNFRVASGVSRITPILAQFLSPALLQQLDSAHGSRGSAAIFTQQLHAAMRTSLDPVTGGVGYSGASAGRVGQEVFENLFGKGADTAAMRGMSAGQAGLVANELQSRGLLGRPMGSMPVAERLSSLPRQLDPATIARLAEQLPEIQDIIHAGKQPTTRMLRAAEDKIRNTHSKMRAAKMGWGDIENFPGAAALLGESQPGAGVEPGSDRTLRERLLALPDRLSDEATERIAGRLPGVTSEQVRKTHQQLTQPNLSLTAEQIGDMPGGNEIIRAGDAHRIGERLKNMAGAVKAMRDIFGDMGNPNAPMRQIINGLDALTQGGLATMSSGEMEMMVRKTHNIAKQTGVGMQGMMGMAAQNAALADQLGLDRKFAVIAANQGAAFGAAAGDTLQLGTPTWGALTKEQLTLSDQKLRMHAAASPLANQLNALMRMTDTGMLAPAADTELAAITKAVQEGQTEYAFNGKNRSVAMDRNHLMGIMSRDAGVNRYQAYGVFMDRTGNQEYGKKFNTMSSVRRIQGMEASHKLFAPALSNQFRGTLVEEGVDELLQVQGIVKDRKEFGNMMDAIGLGVSSDFLKLDEKTVRTEEEHRVALGNVFRARFAAEVRKRVPNATAQEVTKIVDANMQKMGGAQGLANTGTSIFSSINAVAAKHPEYRSAIGHHNLNSAKALQQGMARERRADADSIMQSAMAGLGASGPIQRISDALQTAGPNTSWQDLIGDVLGGVDLQAIAKADPGGSVAGMLGLLETQRALDPSDPAQFRQYQRNANVFRGLLHGGAVAKESRRKMDVARDADGKLTYGSEDLYDKLGRAIDTDYSIKAVLKAKGKGYISEEDYAETIADRLIGMATPAQAASLRDGGNREKLVAALMKDGRSAGLDRAIHARKQIMQMAVDKGVFGADVKKVSDLTAAQQTKAAGVLRKLALTDKEKEKLEKASRAAEPVSDFGLQGLAPADISEDALRRINKFQGTTNQVTTTDQPKELNVKVTGVVEQREDGRLDLELIGKSIIDESMSLLGTS